MRPLHCWLFLLAFALFSLSGSSLRAQTSSHPLQILPLGIQDRRGQFVQDIQLNQIVIKGLHIAIRQFEVDKGPRRILLLLDTSGSMGNRNSVSWSNVVQVATHITRQLKQDDLIAVDTFAEKNQILVPFTMDTQLAVRRIRAVPNSGLGRTMLGLALREILGRRENGLRLGDAIILISDGERSQDDRTDFARLGAELTRVGVRICFIRVPPVRDFGVTSNATDISNFVREVGGMELNTASMIQQVWRGDAVRVETEVIDSTAKAAYAFVEAYYRLGLEISEPTVKPIRLQLDVVDRQKKRIRDVQLSYSRYLFPSPAE